MKVVEVFADVVCPFTHVGLHRFVDRLVATGADVAVRVRAWPLELVNGAPLDPAMVAEKVAVLRCSVAPDLFAGFDPARWPSTSLPALALVAAAYRVDDVTGLRASLLVRDVLFEDDADITDPAVLAAIAAALGVDDPSSGEADVLADWRDGRARGVQGSPHFFVDGEGFFCPALHIEHVDGHLVVRPDPGSFDAFVDRCLAEPEREPGPVR
ncbi:MAG: DsbA family protein [Ilumatobacteraceae bacterium]